MQQIALKLKTWSEPRFLELMRLCSWDAARTLGVLTLFWANTRTAREGPVINLEELGRATAHSGLDASSSREVLTKSGYLSEVKSGEYMVVDNEAFFAVREKLQAAGARGGYRKHRARTPRRSSVAKAVEAPSMVSTTWAAYSEAYRHRYQVDPIRNATVMGQLARLVALVGQDAPALARFYVAHESSFYVRCQHSVGVLLKDYSGLYTQLHRNEAVTEHDVAAHSQSSQLDTQLRRLRMG